MNRRSFVRGLGLAALSAPFLNLMPRSVRADGEIPKRLVVLFSPQGQHVSGWRPSDANDPTSSRVLAPLAAYRDRMIAMDGLRGAEGTFGHPWGPRAALTGTPDASLMSLDQVIAERLRGQTALPSLELGIDCGDRASSRISYAAPGLAAPPIHDPGGAFDRIATYASGDEATMARIRARRGSVLDLAARELDTIGAQVGTERRRMLDAHASMVRELETRVRMPAPVAMCELPERPGPLDGYDANAQAIFDIAATALTCDLTRVVTVVMDKAESSRTFPELGFEDNWHNIAHDDAPDATNKLHTINSYLAGNVAGFCDRLDNVMEEDGTSLLDNTVVVWINELNLMTGSGHTGNHRRANQPCVVIGGGVPGGRYHDAGDRPYGDFLLSLAHLMGATDLTRFGNEGRDPIGEIVG